MEQYLSPAQVVAMIPGMTPGRLAQLRFKGTGPRFRKPTPKTVVYVEAEVLEWVEASARMATHQVGA